MSIQNPLSLSVLVIAATAVSLLTGVARAASFVRHEGKHISLTIDVGTQQDAEDLVAAFDAATHQWAAFWNLPTQHVDSWKVDAVVMSDRNAAASAGLIHGRVPDFKFGYAIGNSLYVIAQPSQYYTRHLLLHEGVHSLAIASFGGTGPSWFMEGTAELLSTHQGSGADVTINRIPRSRDSSPYWGRLKVIQDQRESGTIPSLETIMRFPQRLDGNVTAYSWSWAAAMLLTEYPEYRAAFDAATIAGHDSSPQLTRELYQRLLTEWPALVARYRLMSHSLDYGFEWSREQVQLSPRDPAWQRQPLTLEIAADRGWQSTSYLIPAGTAMKITGTGAAILATEPKPWRSEPPGVTIRYHNSQPLGQLVACLVPFSYQKEESLPALETKSIASEAIVVVNEPSWLVFRVNDAVGELADNSGGYTVRVEEAHAR